MSNSDAMTRSRVQALQAQADVAIEGYTRRMAEAIRAYRATESDTISRRLLDMYGPGASA